MNCMPSLQKINPPVASPLLRKWLDPTLDMCMNPVARRSVAECSSTLICLSPLRPMIIFMPGGAAMRHGRLVGDLVPTSRNEALPSPGGAPRPPQVGCRAPRPGGRARGPAPTEIRASVEGRPYWIMLVHGISPLPLRLCPAGCGGRGARPRQQTIPTGLGHR
jgi:hypothetical protein